MQQVLSAIRKSFTTLRSPVRLWAKAKQLQGLMASFGIDAKIVLRKRYFVVYIKEGSQIVDLLNVMEAPVALMELENIRILKEMRGTQ